MKIEAYELPRYLAASYTQSPAMMLDEIRAVRDGLTTHPAVISGTHLGETYSYLFFKYMIYPKLFYFYQLLF